MSKDRLHFCDGCGLVHDHDIWVALRNLKMKAPHLLLTDKNHWPLGTYIDYCSCDYSADGPDCTPPYNGSSLQDWDSRGG